MSSSLDFFDYWLLEDKLIHDYSTVNAEVLWNTVTEDLPSLLSKIQRILRPVPMMRLAWFKTMTPVDVRSELVDALRLDLIGPGEVLGAGNRVLGDLAEILPQRPSTWYLAGFLVPLDAAPEQKTDEQGTDEVDVVNDGRGLDDAVTPDPGAARVRYLPSSIGVSVLIAADTKSLQVTARWGDYKARKSNENEPGPYVWIRTQRERSCSGGTAVTDGSAGRDRDSSQRRPSVGRVATAGHRHRQFRNRFAGGRAVRVHLSRQSPDAAAG
jgi:hypothetical protein